MFPVALNCLKMIVRLKETQEEEEEEEEEEGQSKNKTNRPNPPKKKQNKNKTPPPPQPIKQMEYRHVCLPTDFAQINHFWALLDCSICPLNRSSWDNRTRWLGVKH